MRVLIWILGIVFLVFSYVMLYALAKASGTAERRMEEILKAKSVCEKAGELASEIQIIEMQEE